MPDSPSLIRQLANRTKSFHSLTGISQATLAKAIQVKETNYSAFLAGKRGLSASSVCLLLKFINMPAPEVLATFSKNTLSSKIMKLQESGRLKFDSSVAWQPGSTTNGTDPNDAATPNANVPNDLIEQIICALLKLKSTDRATVVAAIVKAVPESSWIYCS